VLEPGARPSICAEDPWLALDRYVYVESAAEALSLISRGERDCSSAIASVSVQLYGEPELVRALPGWFRPAGGVGDADRSAHLVTADQAGPQTFRVKG
jgi:hypothetical protein